MDCGEICWVNPMVKMVVQGVLHTNPLVGFLACACRGRNFINIQSKETLT